MKVENRDGMLRIQEFAKAANVTVRTLHHYDRLGLLSPSARSANGYRLYREEDLAQLERILVLRYVGVPLRQIAEMFAGDGKATEAGLARTLAQQRIVLREKRKAIERVLISVEQAIKKLEAGEGPDWLLYQFILKEIHMQEKTDWAKGYYSEEALAAVEERKPMWSPELQAKTTTDWQQIYADVESALDRKVEPTSEEGKALAARWMKLVEGFTGGNPEVMKGLNKMYADRANWPSGGMDAEMQKSLPKPEYMAFVRAAQGKA